MKNLRVGRCPGISNRIHSGCKMFVSQIFRFEENGEPFFRSKSNLESNQRVGIGKERVGLVDRVTCDIALHVWSGVKAGCCHVKQVRFIKMYRHSRDAVVAIDGITIEMKIVQCVGLT